MRKLSPTVCVVDGYLVISTTADAARQIIAASRAKPAAAPDAEGTVFGAVRVDVSRLVQMLNQHAAFLVKNAVEKNGKPRQQAEREMTALRVLVSMLESVELQSAFAPGRTDHVFRIEFADGTP